MKKILFVLLTVVGLQLVTFSQSEMYTKKMQETLQLMDSAKTIQDLQEVSAQFERIGDAEKTQWLPFYYAALANINIGWMDQKADKDKLAEKSKSIIAKAEAIEKNSELYVLSYMVATQQMLVDPAARWMSYSVLMDKALADAKKADPNNPRVYYMEGQGVMGKPEAFGGGKAKAKPIFQKAVDLYKSVKPASPLHPRWGQTQSEELLAKCSS